MPNIDAPRGFEPLRHVKGGVIRASGTYKIQSGYATSLFTGDAVIANANYLNVAADNSAVIAGIFAGCRYRASDGSVVFSNYWPASTATLGSEDVQAYVFDDPGISYRVQTDTGTAYVDATHKGNVYDIELDHAGSAITGQSGMEIDLADTGTGQFQILGLIDEPGNAAGVNAKVEVIINVPLLA
jgi:hypothetical protein